MDLEERMRRLELGELPAPPLVITQNPIPWEKVPVVSDTDKRFGRTGKQRPVLIFRCYKGMTRQYAFEFMYEKGILWYRRIPQNKALARRYFKMEEIIKILEVTEGEECPKVEMSVDSHNPKSWRL